MDADSPLTQEVDRSRCAGDFSTSYLSWNASCPEKQHFVVCRQAAHLNFVFGCIGSAQYVEGVEQPADRYDIDRH